MKCPVDQVDLVMSERQGVEIDYCPTCRGVWLDRGELDKILDRAAAITPAAPEPPAGPAYGTPPADARPDTWPDIRTAYPDPRYAEPAYTGPGYEDPRYADPRYAEPPRPGYDDDRSRDSSYDPRYADPRYRRKKKRESWLGDLLDFD